MFKIILLDGSNNGILYIGHTQTVATLNMIKQGFMDVDIHMIHHNVPGFEKIANESQKPSKYFKITPNNELVDLLPEQITPAYLKNWKLIGLRAELVEKLIFYLHINGLPIQSSPWEGIENNLEFVINNSNPDTDTWHPSLLEYAYIHSIEPRHAYKEIQLNIENISALKIRLYSNMTYFLNEIGKVNDRTQQQEVGKELDLRFWKDNSC